MLTTRMLLPVFFSDICGFTTLSSKLDSYQVSQLFASAHRISPRMLPDGEPDVRLCCDQVSEMLERLFSRFDEAAVKHGVYKVLVWNS